MERKRDSDSKNNNSGSEGCALAERKSVPSPNNQKVARGCPLES